MTQHSLLTILDRYLHTYPDETDMVARIRSLVEDHENCLFRTCHPGHITASTWISSPDHRQFLLTHHRKLERWLQLGGHVDGESDIQVAALREAREESGMEHFDICAPADRAVPIDVDVHVIPSHGDEPEHEHHDFRFLLVARPGQEISISEESNDLRWFPNEALPEMAGDASVRRLGEKCIRLLSHRSKGP